MAAPMATRSETIERSTSGPIGPARRRFATALLAVALAFASAWFAWRLVTLPLHPIPFIVLLIELSGWTGGVLVARGLVTASGPRGVLPPDDTYRYASVVADRVGRTRAADLQHDLRAATERLTTRSAGGPADRAVIGMLVDGPRRIALVVMLSTGLLVGVAPSPPPPWWAVGAIATGSFALACCHVVASGRGIHLGDRTRWSFASLGEVVSPTDRADVAPRRWVGTVGAIVVLNLAVGLRGMSDRWTHGLPAMADDDRVVAMTWASLLVLGGLYALRTIPTPKLGNAHTVARRLEERTARQSALGAAVCVGLIGLLAGVLPGGVDAGSEHPDGIEPVTQIDAGGDVDD